MKTKSSFIITIKPHGGIPAKKLRRFENIINRALRKNGKLTQEAWNLAAKRAHLRSA